MGTDHEILFALSQLCWGQISDFFFVPSQQWWDRLANCLCSSQPRWGLIRRSAPSQLSWGQTSKSLCSFPTMVGADQQIFFAPPKHGEGRSIIFFASSQTWWGQINKFSLLPSNYGEGRSATSLCSLQTMVGADQKMFFIKMFWHFAITKMSSANWKLIERCCLSPTYIRLTKIISYSSLQ